MATKRTILGSGWLYIDSFTSDVPEDAAIEVDANLLGYIKAGATLEYKPTFYTAKDDMGVISETYITEEEASLKAGIMTFNGETLKKLTSTATVTTDTTAKTRTVKIGGIGNYDREKYILRFVHEDSKEGDVRVTIVGNNQAGWTLAFKKDGETIIDAEFKAMPIDDDGTLIIYEEADSTITAPEEPEED